MRMIARRLKEATIKKQTPEMVFVVNREKLFFYINLITSLKFYLLVLFDHLLKLSSVRKVLETIMFLALGIIETLGSIISLGTSKKFADVRTHLRKVSKSPLSSIRKRTTIKSDGVHSGGGLASVSVGCL